MRRKLLQAVVLAGTLWVAGGALLHQPLLGSSEPLAHGVSATGAMLAAISEWIQLVLEHTSPGQLVEGVGVAWFIFVLMLLLLTRTDRAEPLDHELMVRVSPGDEYDMQKASAAALADSVQAGDTPPCRSSANPPVPRITTRLGLTYWHLLTPTGIAATERQSMSYGLFVVAEFVGVTSNRDEAGRRTVNVIVSQVAPLLAHDTALADEHFSALFELAVLRATYVLRHTGIRTAAADVRVLVSGIIVIGNDIYVVYIGH
jgi:hypothetical protein